MPPSFIMECQECTFVTNNYLHWKTHLVSEGHQVQARERSKTWAQKAKEKALVIFGVETINTTLLMKHFGRLALVSDFVFWKDRPDFCIIQFFSPTFFESFLPRRHIINDVRLILRRREEISDEEWKSICPFLFANQTVDQGGSGTSPQETLKDTAAVPNAQDTVNMIVDEVDESSKDDSSSKGKGTTADDKAVEKQDIINMIVDVVDEHSKHDKGTLKVTTADKMETQNTNMIVEEVNEISKDTSKQDSIKMIVEEVDMSLKTKSCSQVTLKDTSIKDTQKRDHTVAIVKEIVPPAFTKLTEKDHHQVGGSDQQDLENSEMWDNPPPATAEEKKQRRPKPVVSVQDFYTNEEIRSKTYNYSQYERQVTDTDLEMWNFQMDALYTLNLMPMEDWNFRNRAKMVLERLVKIRFPNCILIPFGAGSAAISFGNERETFSVYADLHGSTGVRYSTVPMFMDIPPNFLDEYNHTLVQILQNTPYTFGVQYIAEAAEILLTYKEHGEELKCRITMKNFLPVQCCRIIKFVCSLDNRVRPLLIVARNWAYHHHLVQSNPGNEDTKSQHFHGATIQWLVIFFLATKNIIPPISMLQQYSNIPLIHRDTNLAFCTDPNVLECTRRDDYEEDPETGNPSARCILGLFLELLQYCERIIPHSDSFLSVHLGKKLPIHDFSLRRNRNIQDEAAIEATRSLDYQSPLRLQHPLILVFNMAKDVSKDVARTFRYVCGETSHKLTFLLNGGLQNCNPVELLRPVSLSSICGNFSLPEYDPCVGQSLSEAVEYEKQLASSSTTNKSNDPVWTFKPIAEVGHSSKKLKTEKSFRHQVHYAGLFRRKAINIPNIQEHLTKNYLTVYFEIYKHFNNIVWPVCFGVKLIAQQHFHTNEKLLIRPFKGYLTEPKKLEWLKKISSKTRKECWRQKSAELFGLLRTTPSLEPIYDEFVEDNGKLTGPPLFEFECKVSAVVDDQSESYGIMLMNFTNIIDPRNTYNMTHMMLMYNMIWKFYSIRKAFKLQKIQISDEILQLFHS